MEYTSLIESTKFRLFIVHNSKNRNKISFGKQSATLPNLLQLNSSSKQFLIDDLREKIRQRTKEIVINPKNLQIAIGKLSTDYQLMHQLIIEFLTEDFLG